MTERAMVTSTSNHLSPTASPCLRDDGSTRLCTDQDTNAPLAAPTGFTHHVRTAAVDCSSEAGHLPQRPSTKQDSHL